MNNKSPLGKGLGSLIPHRIKTAETQIDRIILPTGKKNEQNILYIPVDNIDVNPYQPRRNFDQEELSGLVESIKQHGIIQPLVVSKDPHSDKVQLISGERRLRAAREAGLETVPVILKRAEEMEKLELALIENIQRQDLNIIELAQSYKQLIDEFGLTQDEAAKRLGKKRSTVANTLRVLELPGEIQKALAEGRLTFAHAKLILAIGNDIERIQLYKQILAAGMTVRDTEKVIKKHDAKSSVSILNIKRADLVLLEKEFSRSLGTKVVINDKNGKGSVSITYSTPGDLRRISSILKR